MKKALTSLICSTLLLGSCAELSPMTFGGRPITPPNPDNRVELALKWADSKRLDVQKKDFEIICVDNYESFSFFGNHKGYIIDDDGKYARGYIIPKNPSIIVLSPEYTTETLEKELVKVSKLKHKN